ncbi:transcriptional regulator [Clostridia bacterium]|nr:transcriptional regulator [Clostridia bacterium]
MDCDCVIIHEDVVDAARAAMPEQRTLIQLAELFKVFGEPTRVKILSALQISEMCVCDIAALLGMTKSAISHQLRALRQAKLVKFRKEGKIVYYSPDDEHIGMIFKQGLAHVSE